MPETETEFEYRLSWSAGTNINFKGRTDWMAYDGFEETEGDIYEALESGRDIPPALEEVLEACGFEWGLEVRPCRDAAFADQFGLFEDA